MAGTRMDASVITSSSSVFEPLQGEFFRFGCGRGLSCFNRCCAGLRLILTPYDVLRMKRRLGMPSDRFLDEYTETFLEKGDRFPMVRLKMTEGPEQACPFVAREGCRIYEDRPGACRLYPLGRASSSPGGPHRARQNFFLVREDHCMGFQEKGEWTPEEWLSHEGLADYLEYNDRWLEIVTAGGPLGERDILRKHQMFFMVSYNLDRFRSFVLESRFLQRFEVEPELAARLPKDDISLLELGFDWLKFGLFGEKTMKPRSDPDA